MKLRNIIAFILMFSTLIGTLHYNIFAESETAVINFEELLNDTENLLKDKEVISNGEELTIPQNTLVGYNKKFSNLTIAFTLNAETNDTNTWFGISLRSQKVKVAPWDAGQSYNILIRNDTLSITKTLNAPPINLKTVPIKLLDNKKHMIKINVIDVDNGVSITVFSDDEEVITFVDSSNPITESGHINFMSFKNLNATIAPAKQTIQATTNKTELQVSENISEYEVLYTLGIISEDNMEQAQMEKTLTRAEFISMAVNLANINKDNFKDNESTFSDVHTTHPYSDYINAAVKNGLVNGYSDGTFRPDNEMLYEEVVKLVVSILGYDSYANAKGGYPFGYMITAAELGLFKNIDINLSDKALIKNVYKILINSLEIDKAKLSSVKSDASFSYESQKGNNLLLENFSVTKITGIITANEETALTSTDSLRRGYVRVNNKNYKLNREDYKKYLGYNSEIYIKNIDDNPIVLLIRPKEDGNNITEIEAGKIVETPKGYPVTKLKYYDEKENEKTINISPDADYIYNGSFIPDLEADRYNINAGTIIFIDNNNDGIVDIVSINEYFNYVVDYVSTTNNTIFDKYGRTLFDIDLSDNGKTIEIKHKNKAIDSLELIKEWDILSVAKSEDERIYKIFVSRDSLSGEINEVDSSDEYKTVLIKDKKIEVSKDYLEQSKIDVGVTGKFYLDFEERIAAIDFHSTSGYKYGYLIAKDIKNSLDKRIEFKILTEEGKVITLKSLAKEIFLNDTKRHLDVAYSLLPEKSLIQYRYKDINNISHIKTYEDNRNDQVLNPLDKFTLDFKLDAGRKMIYREDMTFANKFILSGETKVFVIPTYSDHDDSDYGIGNILSFKKDKQYEGEIYDIDENRTIGVMLMKVDGAPADESFAGLVVSSSKAINKAGEKTDKINLLQNGNENGILAKKYDTLESGIWAGQSYSLSNLPKGSLIQVNTDKNNELLTHRTLFAPRYIDGKPVIMYEEKYNHGTFPNIPNRITNIGGGRILRSFNGETARAEFNATPTGLSSDPPTNDRRDNTFSALGVFSGKVLQKNNLNIIIDTFGIGRNNSWNRLIKFENANISLVEDEGKKIKKISSGDIIKNDFVVVRFEGIKIKDIVIYR